MEKEIKILVIRNDHIGDLVISTQVFRELKKAFPQSKITLIVSKVTKEIVLKDKNIDEMIELEMPQKSFKSLLNYFKMSNKIRKMKFDIGIDLRGSMFNSGFLLWLAGVKIRVGKIDNYESKWKQRLMSFFLTKPVFLNYFNTNELIVKENIAIINTGLGLTIIDYKPEIVVDYNDEKEVDEFLKQNKLSKYVCILPFAGLQFKQWSLSKFKELISWIDSLGFKTLLMGVTGEEDELKELASKNSKITINFNLRKMLILFRRSTLIIGHDGGPIQIAGISGTKSIELLPSSPPVLVRGKTFPLFNSIPIIAKEDMNSIKLEDVKKVVKECLQ